ncbi:MAG: hypothetical protein OXB88_01565 [Bacteriovoracales bacterium]|nr:hypothetical protein [Bacteriovoracales bacterium]
MSGWVILAGLIPLLLFVIVDSFYGPKAGIVAAAVAATIELVFSLVLFQSVDALTLGSFFLIFVMGWASWKMNGALIFKMQPVVVGLAFSLTLIISYAIGQPILTLLITKYKAQLPPEFVAHIDNPLILRWFDLSTLFGGLGIFVQSLLVAWAAWKLNNWWWIAFRGIGFYVFFIGGALVARFVVF